MAYLDLHRLLRFKRVHANHNCCGEASSTSRNLLIDRFTRVKGYTALKCQAKLIAFQV